VGLKAPKGFNSDVPLTLLPMCSAPKMASRYTDPPAFPQTEKGSNAKNNLLKIAFFFMPGSLFFLYSVLYGIKNFSRSDINPLLS
jgi:hypothetical protein